jgi:hypothetical protein
MDSGDPRAVTQQFTCPPECLRAFTGCPTLLSRFPACDSQPRLDLREWKQLATGPPQPDHAPRILLACLSRVFRIVVFDPNQHSAVLSSPGNHDAFTLGAGQVSKTWIWPRLSVKRPK